jgi:hypothetical protein
VSLLTVAEAASACRVTGALDADKTAWLTAMIAALPGALEPVAGPIEADVRAVSVDTLGRWNLVLPWRYRSISSIACDGVTLDADTYDVTLAESGIVRPAKNGTAPWASSYATTVTAAVGYITVPGNLLEAARRLIQSWWSVAYSARGPASEAQTWAPPDGDLPPAVMQSIGISSAMAGFA